MISTAGIKTPASVCSGQGLVVYHFLALVFFHQSFACIFHFITLQQALEFSSCCGTVEPVQGRRAAWFVLQFIVLLYSTTVFQLVDIDRTWQPDADQGGEDQDQGQDQAALALANLDVEGPPGPKTENNNSKDNNNSKYNNNKTLDFVQVLCWVWTTK